jgi:hypothetical protein
VFDGAFVPSEVKEDVAYFDAIFLKDALGASLLTEYRNPSILRMKIRIDVRIEMAMLEILGASRSELFYQLTIGKARRLLYQTIIVPFG